MGSRMSPFLSRGHRQPLDEATALKRAPARRPSLLRRGVAGLAMLSALAVAPPCSGEAERLGFQHLTVEDGLSSTWVRVITKDSRGFLWLGTANGLNRYDGAEIVTYRHDPQDPGSLATSYITAFLEDRRKRFWVGLGEAKGGVALYDRDRDRFEHIPIDPRATMSSEFEVNEIREDREGRLWIAATNGLHLLDPDRKTVRFLWKPPASAPRLYANSAWDVIEDPRGRIWVSTTAGLYLFDPKTGTASRWTTRLTGREAPSREVYDMYLDETGVLWCVEFGNGLFRIDTGTLEARFHTPDPRAPGGLVGERPKRVVGDGRGHIYVGTEDAGLSVLDLRTNRFTHYQPDADDPGSLAAPSVYAIYPDDQDTLWVGTFNGGLDLASPFGRRFGLLKARNGQLSNPHVTAVIEDRRRGLWIGTDGGGLNRLDRATGRFTYYRHDPGSRNGLLSDAVLALLEDRQGKIWIGTWGGGLQALDPETGGFTSFRADSKDPASLASNDVWTITEDRAGRLLVGTTSQGLQVLDRATGRFESLATLYPGTGVAPTNAVAEDAAGNLWLGHDQAECLDPRTGRVTPYRLDAGRVLGLLVDSRDNLWFATETGGLQSLESKTRALRRFTTTEGLPSNNVSGILEDASGSLWLGTTNGLVKFEDGVRLPKHPRFVTFDARDGLQGDEFKRGACFKGHGGEMFFGGQQGLTFFFPESIRLNPHAPAVILTDVRVFNASVAAGAPGAPLAAAAPEARELVLSPEQSMVTFEFAALNFVLPEKNRYSYQLEGFDPDWSPASADRTATYTNLPPGTYRFRVRAANNDHVWNETGTSLAVRRTPRFRETPWFGLAVFVGLAVGAAGVHGARVLSHLRTERELQARVTEALARIKTLSGLLPICAWCKRVRDDGGYWNQIETYVKDHSEAEVAQSLCPDCAARQAARAGATPAAGERA